MAVQSLPVVTVPFQGFTPLVSNLTAATNVDFSFVNDGYTVLFIANGTGSPITVKVTSVKDNSGRIDEALTTTGVTQADGIIHMYGPFRPIWFNEAGKVFVNLSSITATVSIGAFKFQF